MSRRRGKAQGEVELNLAAMLDMAFQLLTFFILTFKPAATEGQFAVRMPDPTAVTTVKPRPVGGEKPVDIDPSGELGRLVVSIFASPEGKIQQVAIGENRLPAQKTTDQQLAALDQKLREAFTGTRYNSVILQAGSGLHYDQLMKTVDVCTRQKLPTGERLSKLSFVELADGSRR